MLNFDDVDSLQVKIYMTDIYHNDDDVNYDPGMIEFNFCDNGVNDDSRNVYLRR